MDFVTIVLLVAIFVAVIAVIIHLLLKQTPKPGDMRTFSAPEQTTTPVKIERQPRSTKQKYEIAVISVGSLLSLAGIVAVSFFNSFWPSAIYGALIGVAFSIVISLTDSQPPDTDTAFGAAILGAVVAGVLSLLFSSFKLEELIWLPIIGVVGGLIVWAQRSRDGLTSKERSALAEHERNKRSRKQQLIDNGLIKTETGHECPLCGGTQFKARRTAGQRTAIGTAGVLTGGLGAAASAQKRAQKVQCITCGTFFDRITV